MKETKKQQRYRGRLHALMQAEQAIKDLVAAAEQFGTQWGYTALELEALIAELKNQREQMNRRYVRATDRMLFPSGTQEIRG